MEYYTKAKAKFDELNQQQKAKLALYGAVGCFFLALLVLIVHFSINSRSATRLAEPYVVSLAITPDSLAALELLFHRSDIAVKLIVVAGHGHSNAVRASLSSVEQLISALKRRGLADTPTIVYGNSGPS